MTISPIPYINLESEGKASPDLMVESCFGKIKEGILKINLFLRKTSIESGASLNQVILKDTEVRSLANRCIEIIEGDEVDQYYRRSENCPRSLEMLGDSRLIIHFNRGQEALLQRGGCNKCQLSYDVTHDQLLARITPRKDNGERHLAVEEGIKALGLYEKLEGLPYVLPCLGGRILEAKDGQEHVELFFPLAVGGDLMNAYSFTSDQKIVLFKKLLQGLSGIHAQGLIHRDMKLENAVLDENGDPQIIDFGLAHHKDDKELSFSAESGTLEYMPPEQLERGEVSQKGDVYATGVMFAKLFFDLQPPNLHSKESYAACYKRQIDEIHKNTPIDDIKTRAVLFVIRAMMRPFETRISADAALRIFKRLPTS